MLALPEGEGCRPGADAPVRGQEAASAQQFVRGLRGIRSVRSASARQAAVAAPDVDHVQADHAPTDTDGVHAAPREPASAGRWSSFLRFVACGGGTGLVAGAAVGHLSTAVPMPLANALVTVLSTLLANELHSRVTFRRGRAGWRVHVQSTGTAVASYLFTTTAMLLLGVLVAHPGAVAQQAVYLAASALAGIGRFVVLRLFVFAQAAPAAKALPHPVN